MIKLVDLLREIQNDPTKNLSPKELEQYKKALTLLQQQDSALEENLKDSLKKHITTAAIALALLGTPGLSPAQKIAVQDAASETVQMNTTPEVIYSGNPEMDTKSFRDDVLEQYRNINPGFWVENDNHVKEVQQAIKAYRAWTLGRWKQGKSIINYQGRETQGTDKDLSDTDKQDIIQGFMKYVSKTDEDGKNGRYTSRFRFPRLFITDSNRENTVNLGIQGNDQLKQALTGISIISTEQMQAWNDFVDWMENPTLQK